MGPGNTRLVGFSTFETSLLEESPNIARLAGRSIVGIETREVRPVTEELWSVIQRLKVGVGETKIVSGSKTLHHILPELVPPIDREYTIRFFRHHKTLRSDGREEFFEIYPAFHQIATACDVTIKACMTRPGHMHTSPTKVIDNAIVGYVVKRLKDAGESSES